MNLNVRNKFILITGATSGIGKSIANLMARQKFNLILVGRNIRIGNKIRNKLEKKFQIRAYFFSVDISSFQEIQQLCESLLKIRCRLHCLVNNAGGRYNKLGYSMDNIELNFSANYLNHFILTNTLLNAGLFTRGSNIINVVSSSHFGKNLKLNNIYSSYNFNGKEAYGISKLALVMFTYSLSRKVVSEEIKVNAFDPGYVFTKFALNNGILEWVKFNLYYLIKGKLVTPAQAANDFLLILNQMDIENYTGKYFKGSRIFESSSQSLDLNQQDKLWEFSTTIYKSLLKKYQIEIKDTSENFP